MTGVAAVSVVSGPIPIALGAGALTSLTIVGLSRRRRSLYRSSVLFVLSLALVIAAAKVVPFPRAFGTTFPPSFYVWATLPVFAIALAFSRWRVISVWRRVIAIMSVPLLLLFGAVQLDAFYGYLPTLSDVFQRPLPGQVAPQRVLHSTAFRRALAKRAGAEARPRTQAAAVGTVAQIDIPSTVSHFHHRRGWVWLPPAWNSGTRHLPVLVLLAGSPGEPDDWLRGGDALHIANEWAAAHHGIAPIMILPDQNGSFSADSECVNGPLGNADTYLSVDVPHYVIATFDASANPNEWAVAGLSEGGTCALDLVLRHPDRYRIFGDFSGDLAPTVGTTGYTLHHLFDGSLQQQRAYNPLLLLRSSSCVRGWFDAGRDDRNATRVARILSDATRARNMNVVSASHSGGHTFWFWRAALNAAYPWIVHQLNIPSRCPAHT